ncbi:hypothetical protein J2Z43_000927 [Clostridioides mangenotii]|uniref:Uncharacterized protein n=1 Tax=Metaclostridioides mangenotii TaxID=1540 RepID=A0ABS4E9D7_9FIRM|nr:hypothetical protein [Clostridioides mangenotii]
MINTAPLICYLLVYYRDYKSIIKILTSYEIPEFKASSS